MKIGDMLKLVRARKGLSQRDMAFVLGVSQNYLSLIESNRKTPTADTLTEFANALNISRDALMFASSGVPDELNESDAKEFQRLQQNIISLLLFEPNREPREIS